jgi:hypothetical protein
MAIIKTKIIIIQIYFIYGLEVEIIKLKTDIEALTLGKKYKAKKILNQLYYDIFNKRKTQP